MIGLKINKEFAFSRFASENIEDHMIPLVGERCDDGYRFKARGRKHCHMILKLIEGYNSIAIKLPVIGGI